MSKFFNLKNKLFTKSLFILFKNKALYKSYLYKYNNVIYIPLTISDRSLWFNTYIKLEIKEIKFD
jgi:hypothetical protein